MSIFHIDSLAHYTTSAEGNSKVPATGTAPTAGAGFLGAPGVRPGAGPLGRMVNFPATATVELSAYIYPVAVSGKLIEWRDVPQDSGSNGGLQCTLVLFSNGQLSLYRFNQSGGTLLGSSAAGAVSFNVQHHFYCKIVFHDSTGLILVRIDGTTKLSLTGKDTNNLGGAQATDIRLWGTGSTGLADCIWSHLALANASGDLPGQPRVAVSFPSTDGFYTDFTPVGSGSDHKDRVDEATPDDTNYNEGAAPGDKDSYFYANGIPAGSTILAVCPVPRVSKADASVHEIRAFWREGATDYPGATLAVPASPGYLQDVWELNPATSNPFTPAELNAPMEIGCEVVT